MAKILGNHKHLHRGSDESFLSGASVSVVRAPGVSRASLSWPTVTAGSGNTAGAWGVSAELCTVLGLIFTFSLLLDANHIFYSYIYFYYIHMHIYFSSLLRGVSSENDQAMFKYQPNRYTILILLSLALKRRCWFWNNFPVAMKCNWKLKEGDRGTKKEKN